MRWKEKLVSFFPKAVTDFYPYNMLQQNRQARQTHAPDGQVLHFTAIETQSKMHDCTLQRARLTMVRYDWQSPYLTRLAKGVKELFEPAESFHFGKPDNSAVEMEGRYMHLQLTPQW